MASFLGKESKEKQDTLAPLSVSFPKGYNASRSKRRGSVSAEVDKGPGEEKWVKKVIPKTDEAIARIKKATEHSFLFVSLTEDQKKDIYDCMAEVKVEKGQEIIKQYAEGDFFYVVDSGKYDVLKKDGPIDQEGEYKKVYHYDESGSFGELALMYNCPRAATVKAVTDGVLWAVDRPTFRHIVVTNAAKEKRKREEWLEGVAILSKLTKAERSQVADSLVTQEFKDGDYVIKMGDKGDTMYIIESGEAVATQFSKKDKKEVELNRMKAGEYFGERALLTNQKRAANVKAVGNLKVAVIDRATFERLLGGCKKLMTRKLDKYTQLPDSS